MARRLPQGSPYCWLGITSPTVAGVIYLHTSYVNASQNDDFLPLSGRDNLSASHLQAFDPTFLVDKNITDLGPGGSNGVLNCVLRPIIICAQSYVLYNVTSFNSSKRYLPILPPASSSYVLVCPILIRRNDEAVFGFDVVIIIDNSTRSERSRQWVHLRADSCGRGPCQGTVGRGEHVDGGAKG